MRKRIVTLLCVLTLLVCAVSATTIRAEAATNDYRVGYARVDINPYKVDGDFSSGIMELPLRGFGDVWNRLSTKMVDDNGDGKVTKEDGLKATCIAISDHNGETVLLITIDLIGGAMIDEVREEIYTRVQEAIASGELTDVKLTRSQIHYAGTHTHSAPDTTVYAKNGKTGTNNAGKSLDEINTNLGIWMERTVEDVGDAAILALKDRAEATITKDSLRAANDTQTPVKGKVLNTVRHYVAEDKGCIAGDNFNSRGSDPKQVTQVNDTIYVLKCSFADSSKLPVVLANWRGHPSLNSSDSYANGGKNCISADYPSAFRYALEYNCSVKNDCTGTYATKQTCRVAFFQGAGGNVNPSAYELVNGVAGYKWITEYASNKKDNRGNGYGRVLAAFAQHCLNSSSGRTTVESGEIRTFQQYYNSPRRTTGINALAYEAAKQYQAEAATKTMSHPWKYTNADGEYFVIGSKFHASNIVSYWNTTFQKPRTDLVEMELNAIMLGDDVAFVTIPGEPFDYYYKTEGVFTAGNNLWNDLNYSSYGTPFVLGYCNGAMGYIPNSYAYDYNLGSTKWMRGSYESNISPYAKGTGEKMMGILKSMLDTLRAGNTGTYDASCQHCKEVVTWQPFNGTAAMSTGHYYLLSDSYAPQIHIKEGQQVCLDLNGYTLKGETRAIYTYSKGGATFNLMDTSAGQTGSLQGCGSEVGVAAGFGGAAILIDAGNTFNFYGGTLAAYENDFHSVMTGGVLRCSGTVNMYGGTIKGGVASNFTGESVKSGAPSASSKTGLGGTVYSSGTFNMYGGVIENGAIQLVTGTVHQNSNGTYYYTQTVTPVESKEAGITLSSSGKLTISGDAKVENICLPDTSTKYLTVDTTAGPFTGSLGITLSKPLPANGRFGKCTVYTDLSQAEITFANGDLTAATDGTYLMANANALRSNLDGTQFHYYHSLQDAINTYTWSETDPQYIRLMADTDASVQINQNLYLDLNGCTASGNVTVAGNKTLYGMDTQTDDYSVADGKYGKLTGTVTGNVEGVPEMTIGSKPTSSYNYRTGYIKLADAEGISFHRLRLQIYSVALRPSDAGLYYTARINGDEKIREHLDSFGIVLNAKEAPITATGEPSESNLYAPYDPSMWKEATNYYSVLLSNIMKSGNSMTRNAENAQVPVYGSAYVVIDGQTICGEPAYWSLQQLTEAADEAKKFKDDALTAALEMYRKYTPVMKEWNIPRLKMEAEK